MLELHYFINCDLFLFQTINLQYIQYVYYTITTVAIASSWH